jgi:uncharacterized protein (UPF0332 family)
VSPRSSEYWEQAGELLRQAHHDLEGGFLGGAVTAAYYAMLNAANAALSEEARHAKTHKGVWTLFRQAFVLGGDLDGDLVTGAERAGELRADFDYKAAKVSEQDARDAVDVAERLMAAIEAMLE